MLCRMGATSAVIAASCPSSGASREMTMVRASLPVPMVNRQPDGLPVADAVDVAVGDPQDV